MATSKKLVDLDLDLLNTVPAGQGLTGKIQLIGMIGIPALISNLS